jgi:leader peptidase (prepilin peptidase)/N-methyltransferase
MSEFYFPADATFHNVLLFYYFAIGSVVGSFLNVCIYRIPLGQSIVRPRSRCPRCGRMIRWYHNVPVISYLLLRGRCASCGERISPVYPLVEILTAVLFLLLFNFFGISFAFFIYALFGCAVIVLIFVDYYHRLLPAVITFPGVALGLLLSFINPFVKPLESIEGVALGAFLPTAALIAYKWIRKKEGLGHGDIVMLAMVGAFLGWQGVIMVLFFSSLVGSVVGLFLIGVLKKPTDFMLPFGSFIGAAALPAIFWGRALWFLYFSY